MPKYVYYYFNGKGRGETPRFVMEIGGLDWEDRRFEESEWYKDEALRAKMPFGKTPMLEFDGERIDQSLAISRFLARQTGLAGSSEIEAFKVDAIADTINEIRENIIHIFFPNEVEAESVDPEDLKKYAVETDKVLAKLEKYLKTNGGGDGYFVGNKMSWADLHLVTVIEFIAIGYPDALKNFPKLAALDKRVRANPKLANYLSKRQKTKY